MRPWLQAELEDDFDEELEQEIDDRRLPEEVRHLLHSRQTRTIDRGLYFRELLRLQGELVKLQDWVAHRGL
ncbi:polyphosphate kinase 2, partial [Belnapia sp. T18]|nr:polyphosphate kinase 2 [Belnapia arida]